MSPISQHSSRKDQKENKRSFHSSDSDSNQMIWDSKNKIYYHSRQRTERKTQNSRFRYSTVRQERSRSRQKNQVHPWHEKNNFEKQSHKQHEKKQIKSKKHHRIHKTSQDCVGLDKNLQVYDHFYFINDQSSKVTAPIAVWNFLITHGLRPKKVLVIVQDLKSAHYLCKETNFNRSFSIIIQETKQQMQKLTKKSDIILMTQQKSSITLGLSEDDIALFDVVVNYGNSNSIEFYSLLTQFIGNYGAIFTLFSSRKQVERHQKKLKINFKQLTGQILSSEIQKQIFNQIQFNSKQLALLKSLPYSIEQTALRLFDMLRLKYHPCQSVYCSRQGFVTYCLRTDIQFNSMKYIWNFIRQQMSPDSVKDIRDMKKFQDQRGAIFNVSANNVIKWEYFKNQIQKNQKKYKGYKLYELMGEIPKLQDTQTQEYKAMQHKKDDALKNRSKLQLFIAGVPYQVNQVQIRKYFQEKGINLFLVRILRDFSGFSKGIAFGLPESQDHFDRAMLLNGQKFGDRVLRLKLADQRDRK